MLLLDLVVSLGSLFFAVWLALHLHIAGILQRNLCSGSSGLQTVYCGMITPTTIVPFFSAFTYAIASPFFTRIVFWVMDRFVSGRTRFAGRYLSRPVGQKDYINIFTIKRYWFRQDYYLRGRRYIFTKQTATLEGDWKSTALVLPSKGKENVENLRYIYWGDVFQDQQTGISWRGDGFTSIAFSGDKLHIGKGYWIDVDGKSVISASVPPGSHPPNTYQLPINHSNYYKVTREVQLALTKKLSHLDRFLKTFFWSDLEIANSFSQLTDDERRSAPFFENV